MTDAELAMLFSPDLNLSPEARTLVAHVAMIGGGEVPYARLLRMLHLSNEKKLRRVVSEAEDAGWVTVDRQTGRGHSPRFVYTTPKNGTLKDRVPEKGSLNTDRLPENGGVKPPVVVVDAVVVTPLNPPSGLDERTAAVVDRLAGCRGALTDYLLAAVPDPTRRYSYAQTVASWMAGMDPSVWRLPGGALLPAPDRPGMLAASLNELAAGDERMMKRPVGDPANLRTKLNVNLKKRQDHERKPAGSDSGAAHAKGRSPAPAQPRVSAPRRRGWDDAA
jgi:hypothetical protein